jgi:hypothetical protein
MGYISIVFDRVNVIVSKRKPLFFKVCVSDDAVGGGWRRLEEVGWWCTCPIMDPNGM